MHLHVRCIGSGDTTVLLLSGFEVGDEIWGNVEPALTARARVCSYARPGTGTSDPAVSTQSFTTQAEQLSALLAAIGEPGPYVVVGHSFGGAEAVTFASRYAAQVTGLVLIDASPASWPSELCAVADDGSGMAAMIHSTCAGWTDPTANVEHLDVFGSFTEVAGIGSLGSLPMTVITAVERQFADLGATELARLTAAWNQGQQRWADLSTASHVVPVEQTSHHIELDRPDVVIDAVVGLLR
ncbi:MAG: alpha/beta hydrolase [Ilumatobacteraceae bacterium]